ncbi:hypothetical protein J3R83DRAFT_1503 [Lanmaoa asiatica]|nr:hypothetical protein J3R83DRAFT_1503 [Lanmaoa asiatica]
MVLLQASGDESVQNRHINSASATYIEFAPVLRTNVGRNKLENQLAGEAGCGLVNLSMVTFDLHHRMILHVMRFLDPSPSTDVADVLLAVQMERLRVEEALAARDNVVAHLEDAYVSVRQKAATILRLEQELELFKRASTPANTNSSPFEVVLEPPRTPRSDPGEASAETQIESTQANPDTPRGMSSEPPSTPDKLGDSLQSNSAYCRQVYINSSALVRESHAPTTPTSSSDEEHQVSFPIAEEATLAERTITARQAMLGNSPSAVRYSGRCIATNHDSPPSYSPRVPWKYIRHREEHGYILTPVFKCSTNPRVATAHRWTTVDVIGHMNKPTECFYNKDGKWYYAGTYKAFRMDDLTVQEWGALSAETTQAIVRETLAGRKNVSPQNHYETSQLYAAGALRLACIGLHCVGFSDDLYRGVLEQSRFIYWGRSSIWTPVRTTTALSETSDDAKSSLALKHPRSTFSVLVSCLMYMFLANIPVLISHTTILNVM